jgi:hypothetical protein
MEKKMLTELEVEAEYGISVHTLRTWRQERSNIRFVKAGRLVRYRREDVESYCNDNTIEVIR